MEFAFRWQSTIGRGRILTPRERIKLMAIHRDIYKKITGNDPGEEPHIEGDAMAAETAGETSVGETALGVPA